MRRVWLIGFLVALAAVLGSAASAKPPGDTRDSDVGNLLYKFNIATGGSGSNCTNRIFFEQVESGTLGTIRWHLDSTADGLQITDCDATSDQDADIRIEAGVEFWVMIRVAGAKTDSVDLVCTEVVEDAIDDLCVNFSGVTYHSGTFFTKVMSNVSDGDEEVLWTLQTSTGFRTAEVAIYEKL
jgi:hypothetical protein